MLVVSCTEDKKPVAVQKPAAPVTPKLPPPFTYHKAIEVKPGLTLDVLGWGRGSESVGAYLVLRSDSSHLKYRTTSGELDGKIQDSWNMDMDSDGNPELYIQVKGEGEGSHFKMIVYEFSESGNANEMKFPDLTSATKKKYRGQDSVYIKDNKLRREFPLFDNEDDTKPSGRKIVVYTIKGNSFDVDEISPEDREKEKSEDSGTGAKEEDDNRPLID
jgi:hypothetical protein